MRAVFALATSAMLMATLPALPAAGEGSLYERNHALLLQVLPPGSTLEVQVVADGAFATELWSGEKFAAFRAQRAAQMGWDYAAGFQGAPGGAGDHQFVGALWWDGFGPPPKVNVNIPRGPPRTIALDDKLWIQGGPGALTGSFETSRDCTWWWGGSTCPMLYAWTMGQQGTRVGACWIAGTGYAWLFPAPFGGSLDLTGAALCEASPS
jgi:hypothetical protein